MYTSKKGLGSDAVRLSALKVKQAATITKVNRIELESEQQDLVAIRLESLGKLQRSHKYPLHVEDFCGLLLEKDSYLSH